ncbi:MAG: hypothetical protein CMF61_06260 [Magnetococcales bacterium]|nr:hypothetical protein [Magnetococcales bacterium]
MFRTQSAYSMTHRTLGLAVPIVIMFFFKDMQWAFPIAATSFVIGLILLIIKIRFQWRDSQALDYLSNSAFGMDYYSVKNRQFFVDDLALEAYKRKAYECGLVLEINPSKSKAKVNKSHLAGYKRGTDKL